MMRGLVREYGGKVDRNFRVRCVRVCEVGRTLQDLRGGVENGDICAPASALFRSTLIASLRELLRNM